MITAVSFQQLAKAEFFDAVEYYGSINRELALAYIAAVEQAIAYIRQYPEGSPKIGETIRRKLVYGFPYGLLYAIHPDRIRILAVMNQRRRPFYWLGRAFP